MGDETEWGVFAAARGAEGLCTGGVAFFKPRPGGLVGDGEFMFTLERNGRCFRLIAGVGVGVFKTGDLSGTV
jgi:hypothetical protein